MSSKPYTCVEHIAPCNHIRQYARGTSLSQEDELHLAVKQYQPLYRPSDGDVTILACHASAFPKELYEPVWDSLFIRAQQRPEGQRIRAIWIADVANQGRSGELNRGKLGNEPSYYDHARDLLSLVNTFRREMIRPLVGFGHSMGGNIIINLALLHPRLLTTVVAVEPIINESAMEQNFAGVFPLTVKKDRWPSKDAAMSSIVTSPFYAKWDPRTLELYREHGLKQTSDADGKEAFTLMTTKHQEVLSFARAAFPAGREQSLEEFVPTRDAYPDMGAERNPQNAFYKPEGTMTFQQLPFLRPSILYIYGGKTHISAGQAKAQADKLRVTGTATGGSGGEAEGRVRNAVVDGASHFSPFEVPDRISSLVEEWMADELDRWRSSEAEEQKAWSAVPLERRSTVSDDWVHWVQKLWGKKKAAAGTKSKL